MAIRRCVLTREPYHKSPARYSSLLRNRSETTTLAKYHAIISFDDEVQLGRPFKEVAAAGIRTGLHGLMIEHVDIFLVDTFQEIR